MTIKNKKIEKFLMRVPMTLEGERFVEDLKRYLNKDTYKVITRYTGKRPNKYSAHTRKKDATSLRIYTEPRNRREYHQSFEEADSESHRVQIAHHNKAMNVYNELIEKYKDLEYKTTLYRRTISSQQEEIKTLTSEKDKLKDYERDQTMGEVLTLLKRVLNADETL